MLTKTSLIEQYLQDEIGKGNLALNSKIPSRSQLCKKFNCSRTIVERAILLLIRKGYISGRQGSGTYVINKNPERQKITTLNILCEFEVDRHSVSVMPSLNFEDMNISVNFFSVRKFQANFEKLCTPGTAVIYLRPGIEQIPFLEKLRIRNIPVLLLNRDYEGFDCIITDPHSSIREGVSWLLIESGRDIGFISRRPSLKRPYQAERILAFYEAAIEFGAHLNSEWCISKKFRNYTEDIAEVGQKLFGSEKHPSGLFVLDIDLVLPLVTYGQSYGLSPGKDYKLLTFDRVSELEQRGNIAMLKQPELLYEKEIRHWLNSLHTGVPFKSALKTELQVF